MTDDQGAGTGFGGGTSPEGAAETQMRLHASLDLAEIAHLALGAAVPDFADVAAVFAGERLLRGGAPVRAGDSCEVTARRLGTRAVNESPEVTGWSFPAGEMIAFAPESPYARCLRAGEPVRFTRPDRRTLERFWPEGRKMVSRYASFLAVPAMAGAEATGLLAFGRTAGSPGFSDADVAKAVRLASGAGAGIAGTVTLLRQRVLTDALQNSMLVAEPAVPPGIEAAARCLPAAGQMLGGDWYDLIALPGGRSGIIIGDVMGHGPEAAAAMAQLRAAAHALALTDPEPADLLRHLDRTAATLKRTVLATCVYAVVDPAGQLCTLSAAGHLPPVLAMPDGTTHAPDLPGGQSLGLGLAAYGQARLKLPRGATIALYTDGLVETRTRSFDQGILALRAALTGCDGNLEAACDTLIALAEGHEDDVTVVLARVPGND